MNRRKIYRKRNENRENLRNLETIRETGANQVGYLFFFLLLPPALRFGIFLQNKFENKISIYRGRLERTRNWRHDSREEISKRLIRSPYTWMAKLEAVLTVGSYETFSCRAPLMLTY